MWFSSNKSAVEAIENFQKSTATKFIVDYTNKYGEETNKRVRWDYTTGIPFIITASGRYECQHGKDKNMLKKERTKMQNFEAGKKSYNCIQESKKKDCAAKISLIEVVQFPQFKLCGPMKYQHRVLSKQIHKALLNKDDNLIQVQKCQVLFPAVGAHSGHAVMEVQEQHNSNREIVKCSADVDVARNKQRLENIPREELSDDFTDNNGVERISQLILEVENSTSNYPTSTSLLNNKSNLQIIVEDLQLPSEFAKASDDQTPSSNALKRKAHLSNADKLPNKIQKADIHDGNNKTTEHTSDDTNVLIKLIIDTDVDN